MPTDNKTLQQAFDEIKSRVAQLEKERRELYCAVVALKSPQLWWGGADFKSKQYPTGVQLGEGCIAKECDKTRLIGPGWLGCEEHGPTGRWSPAAPPPPDDVANLREENARLTEELKHDLNVERSKTGAALDGSADWESRAKVAEEMNTRLTGWLRDLLDGVTNRVTEGLKFFGGAFYPDCPACDVGMGYEPRHAPDCPLVAVLDASTNPSSRSGEGA